MVILKPDFFSKFPEIVCAISGRYGNTPLPPFENNMSYALGDSREQVTVNRKLFFSSLGISPEQVAWQSQVHGTVITTVENSGNCGESDALITAEAGLALAVSIADCTPVLIYSPGKKIISAVHAGWRGTSAEILEKTVKKLIEVYGCPPEDIYAYIGPSMKQRNYEVGKDTADFFSPEFVQEKGGKLYLDVAGCNYRQLTNCCIPECNIHLTPLCSFEETILSHSYRRDKEKSGRSLALIYRKESL